MKRSLSLDARNIGLQHATLGSELVWQVNTTDAYPGIPVICVLYNIDGDDVDVMAVGPLDY